MSEILKKVLMEKIQIFEIRKIQKKSMECHSIKKIEFVKKNTQKQ